MTPALTAGPLLGGVIAFLPLIALVAVFWPGDCGPNNRADRKWRDAG